MKGDREALLAAGFDGYLEKPISVLEFPDQVRSFCPRPTLGEQPLHLNVAVTAADARPKSGSDHERGHGLTTARSPLDREGGQVVVPGRRRPPRTRLSPPGIARYAPLVLASL